MTTILKGYVFSLAFIDVFAASELSEVSLIVVWLILGEGCQLSGQRVLTTEFNKYILGVKFDN